MKKVLDKITVYELRALAAEEQALRSEIARLMGALPVAAAAHARARAAAGLADGMGVLHDGPDIGTVIEVRTGKPVEFSDPPKAQEESVFPPSGVTEAFPGPGPGN